MAKSKLEPMTDKTKLAAMKQLAELWAEHKRLDQAMKRASLTNAQDLREQGAENWGKLTDALDSLVAE